VLYTRLPAAQRMRLHQQVGEREEQAYGERAAEIASELAVHFEQGRDYRKAVQYLQQAGENALRRLAHQEAVHLIRKGLGMLTTLPDTPERTRQELRLQLALAAPLTATTGYTTLEVERVHTRALELCRQVGETRQLFSALLGLCGFYLERAEIQRAREFAEQGLSLAQSVHDPIYLMWAHRMQGDLLYRLGEFALAREHLEQGIALYNSQERRSYGVLDDPAVYCLSFAAYTLWFLGYADQALQRSHEALSLARELSHPHSLAFALCFAAMVHQHRREGQAAQERAEAAIRLATEQGFPHWVASGTALRGWALAEQGQEEEGIAQVRRGMAAWQDTGAETARPYYLALLAEAYGKAGQAEKGLAALADAPAMVDKTGERRWEAELYRLKGELLLAQEGSRLQAVGFRENTTEAEECFHKAIDVARKQQAKSLELRAVLSLARLWQQQGKHHAARDMLSTIYNWFTEGFDTKDLQEAKALLEELT